MLKVNAGFVPVHDARCYLEDLEDLDEPPVPDAAAPHHDHAVLLADMLEDLRPHQEIGFRKVQLSQILGVVHVKHPYVDVRGPADPVVVGRIQDVDFLLEQNAVDNADQGAVEPVVVQHPVGDDPARQQADYQQVDALELHARVVV